MKSGIIKILIFLSLISIHTPSMGQPSHAECKEQNWQMPSNQLELYYPTSLEGLTSSLIYWSVYPVFWVFGLEGLLIMIPSKYPNGTVRSFGG